MTKGDAKPKEPGSTDFYSTPAVASRSSLEAHQRLQAFVDTEHRHTINPLEPVMSMQG